MTKFTVDDFFEIYNEFCSGKDLRKVLVNDFPDSDLTVLLGTNNTFKSYFVRDAFLFQDTLEMALEDINKDPSFLAKPYFLASGKVSEIEKGKIYKLPFRGLILLDQTDLINIYDRLSLGFEARRNEINEIPN